MTRDEAVKMLQVTRLMLMDRANQPISDLYYALDMAIEALEQTENSSEKPNNCENHCGEVTEMVEDEPQTCDDCIWNVCNYNKAFEDEPQTEEHCETCRHKDECEGATYEYKNTEWWCLAYAPIDEPQTDCAWK